MNITTHAKQRLRTTYLAALGFVAILILSAQFGMRELFIGQESDGRVINIAGKQRMLSQRVLGSAMALRLARNEGNDRATGNDGELLRAALDSLEQAQKGLRTRDEAMGLGGTNSPRVTGLFAELQESFEDLTRHARLQLERPNIPSPAGNLSSESLLAASDEFLKTMDSIVHEYEIEASGRVQSLRRFELVVTLITLLALILEGVFIFEPGVRRIVRITHELSSKANSLERELTRRETLEAQLVNAQRMEAMGQLAAGIAHEINTPTQFIGDNTRFLRENFESITPILVQAGELAQAARHTKAEFVATAFERALEDADIEYLIEEIPRALDQTEEGIERVTNIVRAMKEFAHPGSEEMSVVDVGTVIDRTIAVGRNEWKYVATLDTDFDPEMSGLRCHPNELSQAVLNLIVNAAHAIAESADANGPNRELGHIVVRARRVDAMTEIRVEDSGPGIPQHVCERIFEPFFTTKEIGRGTGQGLAIVHRVMQKHGGTVDLETEMGRGSTFILRFPAGDDSVGPRSLAA